jgi:hypothetical protein
MGAVGIVSKQQQKEGIKFVLNQISFDTFLLALERLTVSEMMKKSHKHALIKMARDILGISYQTYITKHKPHVPKCPTRHWTSV